MIGDPKENGFRCPHDIPNAWLGMLSGAPAGDWPTAVLSPHSGVTDLVCAVKFVAAIVEQLEKK